MHVVLGTGERASFTPAEFLAYHRRVQERYLAEVTALPETYPHFTEHCGLCRWSDHCDAQRVDGRLPRPRRVDAPRPDRAPGDGGDRDDGGSRGRRPVAQARPHDAGDLRQPAPPGRAPGRAARDRGAQLRAARARVGPRVRAPARALPRRPVLRHGGRSVLRRRARVPVRRDVDRGRRAAVQAVLGDEPRRREARVRGVHGLRRGALAALTPTCTSITTRPTSPLR